MSLDIAKQSVDYLHKNLINYREQTHNINLKSNILLFGGEPLLHFSSLIKPLVEYTFSHYPNDFSFDITTNGTFLTEEICYFMKLYNFQNILISFDGIKEVQDKYRPSKNKQSSFDLIMKNLNYYKEYFDDVSIRSTLTEDTAPYFYQNYLFFSNLNITSWLVGIDQFNIISIKLFDILIEQFNLIYDNIFTTFMNNEIPLIPDIIKDSFNNYFISRLNHILNFAEEDWLILPKLENNCGFGLREICIDAIGDIYSCQDTPTFEDNEYYKIGNIKTGINIEKIQQQRDDIKNIEQQFLIRQQICKKDCAIINDYHLPCYISSCPVKALKDQYISTDLCTLFEFLLNKTNELFFSLYESNNTIFLDYLQKNFYSYKILQDIISQPNDNIKQLYIKQIKESRKKTYE